MSAPRPFGRQPGRQVLREQRWSIARAAEAIGVSTGHLAQALYGRHRPNETVRERLPELLGVPLHDLFTETVLSKPCGGGAR